MRTIRWPFSAAAILLALALLSGCAALGARPPVVAVGEALERLGKAFLRTGALYDRLLDEQAVTKEEYREWAEFVPKFQKAYDHAVLLWQAAGENEEVRTLVLRLREELLVFILKARR